MAYENIELQIVTPSRHILSEEVQWIEMPGKEGYLGILPGHAPLITELGIGVLTYRKGNETKYVTVMQGFAEVLPHRVIVLAEISERAEEIDVERTRKAADRAKAEMAQSGVHTEEWKRVEESMERASARLQAAAKRSGGGQTSDAGVS